MQRTVLTKTLLLNLENEELLIQDVINNSARVRKMPDLKNEVGITQILLNGKKARYHLNSSLKSNDTLIKWEIDLSNKQNNVLTISQIVKATSNPDSIDFKMLKKAIIPVQLIGPGGYQSRSLDPGLQYFINEELRMVKTMLNLDNLEGVFYFPIPVFDRRKLECIYYLVYNYDKMTKASKNDLVGIKEVVWNRTLKSLNSQA